MKLDILKKNQLSISIEALYPSTFSKGTQQKGMIVLAFLKKADLYIIDEPFMGLDPRATKRFLNLIESEKKRGAGILMSIHVLDTAEHLCDRFVLIHEGKLLIEGMLAEVQSSCDVPEASLFDCVVLLTGGE